MRFLVYIAALLGLISCQPSISLPPMGNKDEALVCLYSASKHTLACVSAASFVHDFSARVAGDTMEYCMSQQSKGF